VTGNDRMMDWFLRDDFWELTYPFMFPSSRVEKAEADSDALLRLTSTESGSSVLDLCCGPGRFSVPLARRGLMVTGIDTSGFLLDIARNRVRAEDLDVELLNLDMREKVRPGGFDLVVNMFTSFGYFEDCDENMKVLVNARESLRPGGRMLLETMGKETLASIFLPATCDQTEEGHLLVQRHGISDDWTRIENDWILIHGDRLLGRWSFSHWIYSGAELRDMMLDAGFSEVRLFGDLDGSPYGPDSSRLVVMALNGSDVRCPGRQ